MWEGRLPRPHPGPRPLPVRRRHAPGRQRDRAQRTQRRRGRARRRRCRAGRRLVGSRHGGRRRIDAESAPERILEAACDLIAADGIDEVRIARVARRAGASTALVHHYFSTREELLEQALVHSFEQAGDERFGDPPDATESATEALARASPIACRCPARQEREWVLWVELWLRAVREPELRPVAARLYRSTGTGWWS